MPAAIDRLVSAQRADRETAPGSPQPRAASTAQRRLASLNDGPRRLAQSCLPRADPAAAILLGCNSTR